MALLCSGGKKWGADRRTDRLLTCCSTVGGRPVLRHHLVLPVPHVHTVHLVHLLQLVRLFHQIQLVQPIHHHHPDDRVHHDPVQCPSDHLLHSPHSVHQSPSPLHSSEPLQELTHQLSTKITYRVELCISGVYRKPCFPNRLCIKSTLLNNYLCINSRQDQAGASSSIATAEWILGQRDHSCRDSHNFTLIQAPFQFQFHLHRWNTLQDFAAERVPSTD